jgi:hypothetical protein
MKQINMRRSTDHGYMAPQSFTLQSLRRALGLVPVTDSLRSLSYWRRMSSATQDRRGSK